MLKRKTFKYFKWFFFHTFQKVLCFWYFIYFEWWYTEKLQLSAHKLSMGSVLCWMYIILLQTYTTIEIFVSFEEFSGYNHNNFVFFFFFFHFIFRFHFSFVSLFICLTLTLSLSIFSVCVLYMYFIYYYYYHFDFLPYIRMSSYDKNRSVWNTRIYTYNQ